ncbi:MAG: hypothetical protein GWP04_00845 [Gammaproteobacteria bacterium]|nr:hypothetical protein [Gammaproteobacteria bacterium]
MTVTRTSQYDTRELSTFAALLLAMIAVWATATVVGLWSHVGGALVAIGAASIAAGVLHRRGVFRSLASELVVRDAATWAILVIAASPLVPARLGPTYAGISLDDLPLVFGAMLALWSVVRTEGWRKVVHPISVPLWLFALWNGVAAVLAGHVDLGELTRGVGRWGLVALAFSLLLRIAARPGMFRLIIGSLVVVGLFEALFGLWAYFVDWKVESEIVARLIGLEFWRPYQPLFKTTPGRIVGTLGVSSNFFGALMLIPTLISGGLFAAAKDRWLRVTFALSTTALFFALVLSYTRASQIAVLAGFAIVLALAWRPRLAGLVAVVVALAIVLTPAASRFTQEGNDRRALAEKAIDTVKKDPVSGLGAGGFVDKQFDPAHPLLIGTPHNSFLLAATETGLPGGILLVTAVGLPGAIAAWGAIRRRKSDILLVAIVAGLAAYGFQTMSNNLFHIPSVAVFYWLAASAAVVRAGRPPRTAPESS